MTVAVSSSYRGWYNNAEDSTLDLYVGYGGASDPVRLMQASTTTVTYTMSTVAANERALRFIFTTATPAMTDGVGVFETDLTVTGTATGHIAATSTWINFGTNAIIPSFCELRNDGFFDGTATLTNANISMQRFHCLLSSNPAAVNLFSLNFSGANSELDAIFDVNNAELALGFTSGTPSASAIGSIPFFWIAGGAGGGPRYIYLYANPG